MRRRFAKIRTSNHTASPLRKSILVDCPAVVRLGSLTSTPEVFPGIRNVVEINTVEAIQNSRNKLRMKECFKRLNIPQASWWDSYQALAHDENPLPYPLVVKRVFGFQGRGMQLLRNERNLRAWSSEHNYNGWFFEVFYNYSREYRLHVAKGIGCFLAWRKLRTREATDRWFFNSENSNWVGVDHNLFNRPVCWNLLEKTALDCLEATGLDIGACDIRIQSSRHDNPKFIVCEINSAPALMRLGIEKYKESIKTLIENKLRNG